MEMTLTDIKNLKPAAEMVKANDAHVLNESKEYRQARDALAAEEIELRRHIVRVAEQRRALPSGGEVNKDYRFDGKDGAVGFAELFGDKDTLVIYSFMYGPQRKEGCPMCTSQLSAWDGIAPHVNQRATLVITARSPIERILAYGKERDWVNLQLFSDPSGDYTRDYVSAEDEDMPGYNVFTRKDGVIRHFWRGEGGKETADPGQDPHDAPDMSALWGILDTTPEGRGTDWYPKLDDGDTEQSQAAENEVRAIIEAWARSVSAADRAGILANHADDLLMFDFPATVQGLAAYDKTWDFFFVNPQGPISFVPREIAVTASDDVAFASCMVQCEGTSGGHVDFRLTTGLRKTGSKWVIVHEHHSVPTTEERFIGPSS